MSSTGLRLQELVLKSADVGRLRDWYSVVLDRHPTLERRPGPDAQPVLAGGQERASDVHVCFFELHVDDFPYKQILALFGIAGLDTNAGAQTGLHHFQLRVGHFADLADQYERLAAEGILPHRSANHGPGTSFYYRDPDKNILELSCTNFDTRAEENRFVSSEEFRRNPSGLEIDPASLVQRFRSGEPLTHLLSISA